MLRVSVALLAIALATGCASAASTEQASSGTPSVDPAQLDRVGSWDSIGAFDSTPVATDAPAPLLKAASRMLEVTSGEHEEALGTLRKLRGGLGLEELSIYALRRADGLPCMIVWRRTANCAETMTDAAHPGVLWMVAAGYPAWARADGVALPSALVGLVADDVRAVSFVENGSERPVEIVNNTFFTDLDESDAENKWNELRIEYASGTTRTVRVPTP